MTRDEIEAIRFRRVAKRSATRARYQKLRYEALREALRSPDFIKGLDVRLKNWWPDDIHELETPSFRFVIDELDETVDICVR